ncbi:hypothetical protein M408DRAFT_159826 [Serendipita vermifera MAFF 305830]|uniref:Uncharacterized protein n=1 Tax=Serendipita vermifera MAFF 305830 TaxID=933852 RepID=A0A0C2WNM2_SERVB|nr:hypothetical protein M408DRAFT_159826 [Serendipita vermifera MAFF 305830]
MKFLRRKSQRDEPDVDYPPSVATTVSNTRDPSPNPVAKDLPPPPLYARFARVTATPSFESLNHSLDAPSASRFSAFNGSTASGFDANAAASPSLRSWSTDAPASQGRAAGSALLAGANNPAVASASTTKPEPIKLKQRGRRVATDSSTTSVSASVEAKRTSSPTKPRRAYTNGSTEPAKPSYEDRFAEKEDVTTRGSTPLRASLPVSVGQSTASPLSNADSGEGIFLFYRHVPATSSKRFA